MTDVVERVPQQLRITAAVLGSADFRHAHQVRYAYVAGSMYKAVASEDMVIRMARAGMLAYFGAGGLSPERIAAAVRRIRQEAPDRPFGLNLLASNENPVGEMATVDALLQQGVQRVEAASFIRPTPALVRYRVAGIHRDRGGRVVVPHHVMAKVSRPEVTEAFLAPPPQDVLRRLVTDGHLTAEEAALGAQIPMVDDLCAEADSGGHTDQRPLVTLLPDTLRMRAEATRRNPAVGRIRVGAAGGLGSPAAVAAAFVMGADFVLTGSVNQCTVEAGTSEPVKDMLQHASVHDMTIVPAGDMLETGTRAQVLRRGLFYPARANKLYELYQRYGSLDEIDPHTAEQVQRKYYRRSFDEVWDETAAYHARSNPAALERARTDPKFKMLLVFKAYFVRSIRLAMSGSDESRVDYQINCGPAMGALNGLLRGTGREDWRNRHVDDIAEFLMSGAAQLLTERVTAFAGPSELPYGGQNRP
ncbi:PfaD family polyunsaturated fatty acid/polyketide biosynthesis protein [Salinispora fenicalii]|uniref:PfaD family polyunsaturated fatty acid/polyketide biosynthesis protein n=1 Tax=Salinispora fenicalii TaxID=1137263 RepID=UPI00036CE59C|nr:PfaD family polyunsaturated fatty acid/polyketide biosynthesis protein [Salinispora fenicalii]